MFGEKWKSGSPAVVLFFFATSSSDQNIPQNTPVENPSLVSLYFSSDVMDVPRIHTSLLIELAYIYLKYTCSTITAPTVTQKIICALPKFAGSNTAEAVGFLRAKKSSARFPSEGK